MSFNSISVFGLIDNFKVISVIMMLRRIKFILDDDPYNPNPITLITLITLIRDELKAELEEAAWSWQECRRGGGNRQVSRGSWPISRVPCNRETSKVCQLYFVTYYDSIIIINISIIMIIFIINCITLLIYVRCAARMCVLFIRLISRSMVWIV